MPGELADEFVAVEIGPPGCHGPLVVLRCWRNTVEIVLL